MKEQEKGQEKDKNMNKVNTVIKSISFSNEQNKNILTLNSAITSKDRISGTDPVIAEKEKKRK